MISTLRDRQRRRPNRPRSLFAAPYTLTTLGSTSLVFLAAFEALAVTTVMPVVTEDLDGRSLYSLAFAATLAAGVVGMVASGAWADRRGPRRPLLVAIAVFAVGLAVAGTADSMTVFVAARFLQGLGAGGITVALYVLVARVYPGHLHPRIFGLYAAAWVVPSMVGPFVAGAVADALSWHWVFLGVVVLVVAATAMIVPALRGADAEPPTEVPEPVPVPRPLGAELRRVAAAVVVAVAVLTLGLGGEAATGGTGAAGRLGWLVAALAVLVAVVAVRGLLPAGTLRATRGLPAAVLLCAGAGATFFSTEVYLPLLLHDRYGLPAWLSGVTLTAGAIAWATGSHVQARLGERYAHARLITIGAALVFGGATAELLVAAVEPHPVFAALGWLLAGGGMGVMYPRISTLVLAESAPGTQGFNTAAKSISESVGASVALTASGLVFQGLPDAGAFVGTLAFTTVLGAVTVLVATRVGHPKPAETGVTDSARSSLPLEVD